MHEVSGAHSLRSCYGHKARLDEAEASARSGIEVLSSYQPQQQLQCTAMLIQCSLGRGDLDNARSQLNRLENLLGNGKYHSDWISNRQQSPGDLLANDRR